LFGPWFRPRASSLYFTYSPLGIKGTLQQYKVAAAPIKHFSTFIYAQPEFARGDG
jgi:hypothetical protein